MNMKKLYIILSLFLSLSMGQEWELTMMAQDVATEGSSDYIRIGLCDGCHDGFHFGEDEYNLPNAGNTYTDIQVFNYDWLGDQDDNGVICDNPSFYIDKRSTSECEEPYVWLISGSTYNLTQNTSIQLYWSIDNLDNLMDDIYIFLYIGDAGYDMRTQSSLIINSNELYPEIDFDTFTETVNIKIISGCCVNTEALDCAGDCFGTAEDDDCGVCGGDGSSCVGEVLGCMDESACNYNSEVTFDNGSCEENDCAGVCGGTSVLSGCNNACNSSAVLDCAAICNGSATLDECGICNGNDNNGDGQCDAILSIDSAIPNEFSINNIYPNPFNPVTTIQYSLPEYSRILIQIYDSNGGLAAELVNASIQPGYYSVHWNPVDYASGIYFVKMMAGSYVKTQKLMLLK